MVGYNGDIVILKIYLFLVKKSLKFHEPIQLKILQDYGRIFSNNCTQDNYVQVYIYIVCPKIVCGAHLDDF